MTFRRRFVTLAAACVLVLGACGEADDDTGPATSPTPAPTTAAPSTTAEPGTTAAPTAPPATTAPTTSPTAAPTTEPGRTMVVDVWFLKDEKLAVVHREVPWSVAPLRASVEELLRGITFTDSSYGLVTTVPAGTALRGVNLANGIATIDLTRRFEEGGGSLSMMGRMAQLVFTATQFPNVDAVVLWLDGEPVEFLGGEGLIVDTPQTRRDFESMSGLIVVEDPGVGDEVTSPLRVTGESNTFEATVNLEVRDGSGRVLASAFTTATAGMGTWGTYDVTLTFTPVAGPLVLEVFEVSPKDGSRIHRVVYPLVGIVGLPTVP